MQAKRAVLKRTFKEFKADNLTDLAAALTYYGVLAIFPAMIALISILGLIGQSATQPLIDNLDKLAPGPGRQIFTNAIHGLQRGTGAAGVLAFVGIAGSLWSASGYVGAFMRASNAIYDIDEGRPIWVIASGLFALYVSGFSSYNKTYGALAGVIIFLVSLWISNVAILLGAELNAELERERHIEDGHPADEEPFVEPRRTPASASAAADPG